LLAGWLALQPEWKLIVAPHEVDETHLRHIEKLFPGALRYSVAEAAGGPLEANKVLLIDRIGLLARLYKYGTVCYVGGGFNKSGHHNILEAAVYGKAVITGPVYEKFAESVALKAAGGSFTVRDSAEMNKVMGQISFAEAGAIAARYVSGQAGATNRILHWIQEKRLLTSA
jgi:3-deoxy-D-manno-octulosonic-acid transferase